MKGWMILLGLLAIATTRTIGFTVERSNAGTFGSPIWSDQTLDNDRRASIEMLFNGRIYPGDFDNVLRDSESFKSAEVGDEKCSSSSEVSQRAKRSGDQPIPELDPNGTNTTNGETVASEMKKTTVDTTNKTHHTSSETIGSQPGKFSIEMASKNHLMTGEIVTLNSKNTTIKATSKNHATSSSSTVSKLKDFTVEPSSKNHLTSGETTGAAKESTVKTSTKTHPADGEMDVSKSKIFKVESLSNSHQTKSDSGISASKAFTVESSSNSHHGTSESVVSKAKESTVESSSSPEMGTSVVTSKNTSDSKAPRNIVLMLVDDTGIAQGSLWKNFETTHKFTVQGLLQNCQFGLREKGDSSLTDSLYAQRLNQECECERFLRSNVKRLLSWARQVKEMNTVTVSATNFTFPSVVGPKISSIEVKEFEDNEESNGVRQDFPRASPDIGSNWHMIDLEKRSTPSATSGAAVPSLKQDGPNGFDGVWDVFDMFSRIRIAFFRILLESLGNMGSADDEFTGRKASSVQPSIVELVTDAIKDLKSVPNDRGFILIAAAPGNEMTAAFEILQREISTKDTLLVLAATCSKNDQPRRFYAEGPGAETLREARAIAEIPELIGSAIANGCFGEMCSSKPVPEPVALSSLRRLSPNVPRKRIARAKDEEETSESTVDGNSTKETVEDVTESKSTPPAAGKRSGSGAENMRVDAITAILGFITSIIATLALNS